LRDIVQDKFGASVVFEQHYPPKIDVVSSFAVLHGEEDVRSRAIMFVMDGLIRNRTPSIRPVELIGDDPVWPQD